MADVEEPDADALSVRGASGSSGGSRGGLSRPLGDGHASRGPRSLEPEVLRRPGSAPTPEDDEDVSRRTAGYGPVCPVVWEGRSRKAPPYPDRGHLQYVGVAFTPRARLIVGTSEDR